MWQVARATILRNHASNLRAYPWSFTFGHIVEGLYVVLLSFFAYHYLIQGQLDDRFRQYAGSSDYLTFAVIGGLLANLSVTMMMNVSRALITEYREGTLEVLLLAPGSRTGYFVGTAIQQLYRVGVELAPVLVIGLLLGLRVPHAAWGSAALAFLLYLVSCFAMGLVLGAVMLATRDTYIVQNTLFSLTTLLCGFQFPTPYLPEVLQWAGQLFPLTGALHVLRDSLLTGTPLWQHGAEIWRVGLLCLVYCVLGAVWTHRTERRLFEKHLS